MYLSIRVGRPLSGVLKYIGIPLYKGREAFVRSPEIAIPLYKGSLGGLCQES